MQYLSMIRKTKQSGQGFTLIEMMVSVALFSIVMMITTGSLLSLIDVNRKAQALHSVMENLNIAVDGMIRSARMGSAYHCSNAGLITAPSDCLQGSNFIAFETYGGNPNTSSDQREYWFAKDANGIGRLYESIDGGATSYPVTAPEVNLQSVVFFVSGSTIQDSFQPKLIVVVKGVTVSTKVSLQTSFTLQATASERALDL
jgi:prepilin-type N-terminal cleavage/methylation domain-containing protein